MKRASFFLYAILLLGVLLGLFYSSSQPYEKQDLRGTLSRFLDDDRLQERWGHISFPYGKKEISIEEVGAAGFVEFFIRKGTHFLTFALLTFLLYRLFAHVAPVQTALPWSGFLAVIIAMLDEWHQTFTPNRTGMLTDVLLDTAGICTMLLLVGMRHKLMRRKRKNRDKNR